MILGGPLASLSVYGRARWGLSSVTMAASLVFGLINHFVLPSPDHVAGRAAVAADVCSTAVLLALTETFADPRFGGTACRT